MTFSLPEHKYEPFDTNTAVFSWKEPAQLAHVLYVSKILFDQVRYLFLEILPLWAKRIQSGYTQRNIFQSRQDLSFDKASFSAL